MNTTSKQNATTATTTVTPPEPIEAPKPCYTPMVDIAETPDEFVFEADLPGTAGDIDVTCEDGVLTISGKVKPRQPADQVYVRQEYGVGDFRRVFSIGTEIDAANIRAQLKDGQLTVRVPKAATAKVHKIPVQST
jgi:HSP20 family molecular chaperone IbpA